MKKLSNKNTFNAKVDIVMYPDNIKYYSTGRNDYTELAITAIQNKPSTIKYISSEYKDYALLCEEAIKQDATVFSLINNKVSNYKKLGTIAITTYPFLVSDINKDSNYYKYFWKLAISQCYKLLRIIDEEKKELFPLIEKAIQQEPLAIFFVDSRISIYSKLCNIAYSRNNESTKYMDINYIDKKLVFEIISKEPEKIKNLDSSKDYYKEACKIAISLNGKLIKDIYYPAIVDDLDSFFELIDIAEKNNPEIVDYSNVLYALCLENRQRKEKILSTPNILGNNLYKLLEEIDDEYESLSKKHIESLHTEIKDSKYIQSDFIPDCPIKVKTRKIK